MPPSLDTTSVGTVLDVVGLAAAAAMGFATQRGGTCTVAAVDEIVSRRTAWRLLAIAEAALWVLAGLLLTRMVAAMPPGLHGYPVGAGTVAGGVLLGLGAFVNRACVVGTVARLGSGEWAYAFTPVGYLLGCGLFAALAAMTAPAQIDDASIALGAPRALGWLLAGLLVAAMVWRARRRGSADRPRRAERIWSPHAATCVIGLATVVLSLTAGAWSYTDVLAELARGENPMMLGSRSALAAALIAGAVLGGRTAGGVRAAPLTASAIARCLAGGATMAAGAMLIPGGNDALLLIGMPLLWPHAWTAFAIMGATIAIALLAQRRLAVLSAARSAPPARRG